VPQLSGNELRPIVRTYVLRDPAHQLDIRQHLDHLDTPRPPCHPQRQALTRVLVDQHQNGQARRASSPLRSRSSTRDWLAAALHGDKPPPAHSVEPRVVIVLQLRMKKWP